LQPPQYSIINIILNLIDFITFFIKYFYIKLIFFNENLNYIDWKLDAKHLAKTGNMLFYKGTAHGSYTLVEGNLLTYGNYNGAFQGINKGLLEPGNTIEFDTPAEAIKAAFKTIDTNVITLDISKVKEK